jgi:hypothetical protein
MNCITSRFDIGKSLDPVNEFWVKNDIRAFGTWFACLLNK